MIWAFYAFGAGFVMFLIIAAISTVVQSGLLSEIERRERGDEG